MMGFVISVVSIALTYNTTRWIGHAMTAGVGLLLLAIVILTGMIQNNRIRSGRFRHIFFYHRTIASGFGLFVIVTFILGLASTAGPLFQDLHGILGGIITGLVVLQVVPSLLVRTRVKIKKIHSVVAFLILPLYTVQIILGLEMAGLIAF